MSADENKNLELALAHVLFIDIVGYSKRLIDEQHESLQELNRIVRETQAFRTAEAAGALIRLPTGDGMALAFSSSPEAPVRCAVEISKALRARPEIPVRMGVHSGPVSAISDVNDRINVAGAGINIAQRVMDCGDAGHILLSQRVAEDLSQYRQWQSQLHQLGECEVKHGVLIPVVNLYTDEVGNPAMPEKLKRQHEEKIPAAPGKHRALALGAALLLLLAAAAGVWIFAHRASTIAINAGGALAPISSKSIAVLPFVNLSSDAENAFFADGVQDEILTNLAKVADLKVISRSSVMQYKAGVARNLRQIAQELGVAHVLEGNVQRVGDQLRVNAQLIEAKTDAHLWAQVYDRRVADLFALQSEIARTITDQLQARLSPKEKAAIDQPPTTNLAAYALYTQAREVERNPGGNLEILNKEEPLLTEAVKLDPNFVLAYCELARIAGTRYWMKFDPTPECRARADAAIEIATRLAPEMGEVHLARGLHFYHGYREYRWARGEFELAQKSLPNEPKVYAYVGYLNRREGRWGEATKNLEQVCNLDPANMQARFEFADIFMSQLKFADCRRVLSSIPTSGNWGDDLRETIAWCDFYEKADIAGLRAITPEKAPDGSVPLMNVELAVYQRDPDRAAQALTGVNADEFSASQPRPYWEGVIARLRKDDAATRHAFGEAGAEITKALQAKPDDALLMGALGFAYANAGEREEALRLGHRAIELLPVEQDAINGMRIEVNLACIYSLVGDNDRALTELTRLMKNPFHPPYGNLRYQAQYESMRGDPRFQELVASLAPKS